MFDSKNINIQRIYSKNSGWVYIPDTKSHKYLKILRSNWRPVRGNLKPMLTFVEEQADYEIIAILFDIIEGLVVAN
jgi:hypothetical protein